MSWFSDLFKGKKNKEQQIDDAFMRVENKLRHIEDWEDPKKLERYILDSCEQIISLTKEIEAEKAEYRLVTNYLQDIKSISEMPTAQRAEVTEVAAQIIELNKQRKNYQTTTFKLTDEQYILMQEEEDIIPDTIKRMKSNELYQDSVKKEMRRLETEKYRLEYQRDDAIRSNKIMQRISMLILVGFISLVLLTYIVKTFTTYDSTTFSAIVFCACAMGAVAVFLQVNNNNRKQKKLTRQMNQIISLLNVVRMKYANVTTAITFVQEKYKVRTSFELNYIWEQYMEAVKERERYLRNNQDLEYFTGRLMRLLGKVELFDRKIWLTQINALVDNKEMANVRHALIERRQKIRDNIEANTRAVGSERDEIDNLMREHNYYVPEIQQIIESVDKLCGLNKNKNSKGNENEQS